MRSSRTNSVYSRSICSTPGQFVAELIQLRDPRVEPWAPGTAEPGPVGLGGGPVRRYAGQGTLDLVERETHPLRRADEGDSPQGMARVLPVITQVAARRGQAAGVVEAQAGLETPLRAARTPIAIWSGNGGIRVVSGLPHDRPPRREARCTLPDRAQ